MMYWSDGWGVGAWLMMTVVMIGFWGLIAWIVITAIRGRPSSEAPQRSAEDILAARFARGEIDEHEYTQRLDTLRAKR